MQQYSWPGNVRELENLVRRLAALYADETISPEIVGHELNLGEHARMQRGAGGPVDLPEAVESHLARVFSQHEPQLPPSGLYQRTLDQIEAPLISMALNMCGGNQIRAAELLGVNRNTLRKKIRVHGIEIVKQSRQGR